MQLLEHIWYLDGLEVVPRAPLAALDTLSACISDTRSFLLSLRVRRGSDRSAAISSGLSRPCIDPTASQLHLSSPSLILLLDHYTLSSFESVMTQ